LVLRSVTGVYDSSPLGSGVFVRFSLLHLSTNAAPDADDINPRWRACTNAWLRTPQKQYHRTMKHCCCLPRCCVPRRPNQKRHACRCLPQPYDYLAHASLNVEDKLAADTCRLQQKTTGLLLDARHSHGGACESLSERLVHCKSTTPNSPPSWAALVTRPYHLDKLIYLLFSHYAVIKARELGFKQRPLLDSTSGAGTS
jgi:hypothetical protein